MSLVNPSFAYEDTNDKYGILEIQEVQSYIDNSNFSEVVDIIGVPVTYYHGDNYTVVDDPENGYFLVTYDKNSSEIFVNNKKVESREVVNENEESYSTSSIGNWTHFETIRREYNIVGLVPSVVGSFVGGAVGGKLTPIVVGALAGMLVGGRFPEYYICYRQVREYRIIDVWTEQVEWRSTYAVYHGDKSDRWRNYWFGF